MDTELLRALNGFAFQHDAFEDPVALYAAASQILFMALLALLAVIGGRRRRAAVSAGLAAGLGLACAQVISLVVERPRPFVTHPDGVHLFAKHAADASFPSDHATAAFAIATAIFLRDRRLGAIVLALAAMLAAARVALGLHYPSDVTAGAAVGAAAALALHAPRLRERIDAVTDGAGRVIRILDAHQAP